MSNTKIIKKGGILFKEGEKTGTLFLIQSGSVSLQIQRQKAPIELLSLNANQIVGESVLSGSPTHMYTAVATSETKVVELPAESIKAQIEQIPQLTKFVFKSLSDRLKLVMTDLRSSKLGHDQTPCPPEQTAKIFGVIYHTVKTKSESAQPGWQSLSWGLMKQYAQRVFMESPKRLEMALNIFVKLGIAKYQYGKPVDNPEGADEIQFVHFNDLGIIEQFFEFYQYYYFKGGKQDLLKTDERMMQLVGFLVEYAAAETRDRHGAVRIDFSKTVEAFKEKVGWSLNADHFGNLETKGLFVKRQSSETGVMLSFDYGEYERTYKVWRVLREVERWNEKGSVDPKEAVAEPRRAVKGASVCSDCQTPFEGAQKFCSECGKRVAA